jgi:hypothetical protein
MPRLSLGLGVQSVRKVGGGGAIPSGIPVASTNSINVQYTAYNQTLSKVSDVYGYNISYGPDESYEDRVGFGIYVAGRWELQVLNNLVSFNLSSDSTYIPTSGWIPSITITAA